MKLYIIVNEWTVEDYTLHEELTYTTDRAFARAELEQLAEQYGITELPVDQNHFTTNAPFEEYFYIREVEITNG